MALLGSKGLKFASGECYTYTYSYSRSQEWHLNWQKQICQQVDQLASNLTDHWTRVYWVKALWQPLGSLFKNWH